MGKQARILNYEPRRRLSYPLPEVPARPKPRSYTEWKFLKTWGRLPQWELEPAGYVLRLARERAGLTQAAMATKLGCSQQAVAQAERWDSNPTIRFLRNWEQATEGALNVDVSIR